MARHAPITARERVESHRPWHRRVSSEAPRGFSLNTPLFYSVRLASENVRYPLPVAGPAQWSAGRDPVRVALPDVPADHIIAASFSARGAPGAFSFGLSVGGKRAETARFGKRARRRARGLRAQVAVPVDFFHTRAHLVRPVLSLRYAQSAPSDYLLSVTVRPRLIEPPTGTPPDTGIAPASVLSQTTLDEADRQRACSPTATAMALGIEGEQALRPFVDAARHCATGLLGVWPQNIWAAAGRGRLGAVELVSDWETVRRVFAGAKDAALRRGQAPQGKPAAMVASVAFGRGELPGSPLSESAGHLVTVRGIDRGAVVAHDPAAPPAKVLRRYEAARFAAAWMRHRGAAYVFASETPAAGGGSGAAARNP